MSFNILDITKLRYSILIFLIFGCFIPVALSQTENKLTCIALVKKDSVILRWVPVSIPVWQTGVKYGYVIRRYTIAKEGVYIPDGLSQGEVLTKVPVKPISFEAFDKLSLSEPRSLVIKEAVYGSEFQMPDQAGSFAGFMKTYKDLEVRFGFALFMCDLSPTLARAAGLQFTDRNVLPDERYVYSVSLVNIPDGMQVDPAVVVLDAGLFSNLPKVSDVLAVFMDKTVNFQWPITLHKGTFTAYILEKSSDGVNYKSVSGLPLSNLSEIESPQSFAYTDSLIANNVTTWYRVKGISPFGEEGPASDIITGKGTPEFSAYAVIDTAELIENKNVILRWRITESKSASVSGIIIQRSDKSDGVFVNITTKPLSPGIRFFKDNNPGVSNYYRIRLTGKDNLSSLSFPYLVQKEDNTPPLIPRMLTGKVDSSGVVTIAWRANMEPDLLGYKVFRANSPSEEFISLEQEISNRNTCTDTINLNTLTHKICYQVVAIDKRYNSSGYSEILELTRPDTIPPAPAIIKQIDVLNGKVSMQFEESPSTDIVMYELFRLAENDSISEKLKIWKGILPQSFVDYPSRNGLSYFYLLKTTDGAGNNSDYKRSVFVPGASPKNVTLKAVQSRNGTSILLSWELPSGFVPSKTIIYRSKAKEPLSILTTIENISKFFEDKEIEFNTDYNYRIRVFSPYVNEIVNSNQIVFKALEN
jgi:uncharacterized protein